MQFTRQTSVYQPIITRDCSQFSHSDSLCDILEQATYRTWWKHIDPFCPTSSCVPYCSLFRLHWRSSTPFQSFCLTYMLVESIQEHLVQHSHSASLGSPDSPWHCLDLHQIHCLPHSHLRSHLDYPSHHSSQPNSWCWNAFRCTILISLCWMTVGFSDLADIQYMSSSSRKVLCRQSWM